MAESKDFNDVLNDIFLGEEREHKESYKEGFKAGSEAGNNEGYHLGYHRGAELGRELDTISSMLSTVKKLQHQLDSITNYLTPLLPLANCHMVEFFTENHWDRLVPERLRKVLDSWDLNYAVDKFWECSGSSSHDNTELNKWISSSREHYLTLNNEYCLSREQLQDRITSWGGVIQPEIKVTEFMTSKKSYEVATMSRLVAGLYDATSASCCVEAGGGRGHLLVALCLGYCIPSLTVDCDESKVRAAAARVKIIQKQWHSIAKRKKSTEERTSLQKHLQISDIEHSCSGSSLQRCNSALQTKKTCCNNVNPSPHINTVLYGEKSSPNELNSAPQEEETSKNKISTSWSRQETSSKKFNASQEKFKMNLHRFATAFITKETDLARVVAENFPEHKGDIKLLLTGLHTCGDLGPASLRIFKSRMSTASVFNVPCCYHLLTEDGNDAGFPMSRYLKGYKIGRNGRMLAAQSIDRVVSERQFPAKSLLYRALLQVLIKTHLPNETISEGKLKRLSSKCDNFHEYFKMADAMLNLGLFDTLPQSCLIEILKHMDCQWRKLVIFYLLRLCLAQVIESVILLDRLLFLFENDFDKVYLVKLFDPVLSPRCHAIVAVR